MLLRAQWMSGEASLHTTRLQMLQGRAEPPKQWLRQSGPVGTVVQRSAALRKQVSVDELGGFLAPPQLCRYAEWRIERR